MRKVAFLVGNDTFPEYASIPSLRFPQNDVNDLAEILGDRETCGFETKLYLNKSSQTVLGDFEETSQGLEEKDTILFYYAGHGILRGTELCLASIETKNKRHGATSIEAKKVLEFLRESNAKRRVLILDCCYSGAIGTPYRGGNAEDALTASAHSSGTCILTASTAIQRAAARENEEQTDRQKGNGVFTKALIDCLREPSKECITVDDLYQFAFIRLGDSSQTPKKLGEQEGLPSEIGNFKQKLARLAEQKREQLISPPTPFPYQCLVGAWKGSLRWRKQPRVDFQVTLVIAQCYNQALAGILYYEGLHTYRNEIVYKGADQLKEDTPIEYADTHIEVDPEHKILKLIFVRKVHEAKSKSKIKTNGEGENQLHTGVKVVDKLHTMTVSREYPPTYQLECVLSKPGARECMNVEIKRLAAPRTAVWTGAVFKR